MQNASIWFEPVFKPACNAVEFFVWPRCYLPLRS